MGCECYFYVRYKQKNEWKPLPLFKEADNDKGYENLYFWLCGYDVYEIVKKYFKVMTDEKERLDFAYNELHDDEYNEGHAEEILNNNEFPMYEVTLSYLKWRTFDPIEDDDDMGQYEVDTLKRIVSRVDAMVELADMEYFHPDNIKIMCYASY